jgi:hypothetical protein
MKIVTELSWLKIAMPKEIGEFLAEAYPGMQSVEENIETAKRCGYCVEDHFTLPERAGFDDYCTPMEKRIGRKV